MNHGPIARELRRIEALAGLPSAPTCREIRIHAGVSQSALAERVGCTQSALSRWEAGEQLPRGDLLVAYVVALQGLARAIEERALAANGWAAG